MDRDRTEWDCCLTLLHVVGSGNLTSAPVFFPAALTKYNNDKDKLFDIDVLYGDIVQFVICKCKVNVHVYSPDIPVASANCTIYTPGIGTHSFTVSSPLGRIQHLRTLLQL